MMSTQCDSVYGYGSNKLFLHIQSYIFLGGHKSASSSIGSLNSSFNDGASGTSTPRKPKSRSRTNSLSGMRRSTRKTTSTAEYKLEEGMTVLFNNDMGKDSSF